MNFDPRVIQEIRASGRVTSGQLDKLLEHVHRLLKVPQRTYTWTELANVVQWDFDIGARRVRGDGIELYNMLCRRVLEPLSAGYPTDAHHVFVRDGTVTVDPDKRQFVEWAHHFVGNGPDSMPRLYYLRMAMAHRDHNNSRTWGKLGSTKESDRAIAWIEDVGPHRYPIVRVILDVLLRNNAIGPTEFVLLPYHDDNHVLLGYFRLVGNVLEMAAFDIGRRYDLVRLHENAISMCTREDSVTTHKHDSPSKDCGPAATVANLQTRYTETSRGDALPTAQFIAQVNDILDLSPSLVPTKTVTLLTRLQQIALETTATRLQHPIYSHICGEMTSRGGGTVLTNGYQLLHMPDEQYRGLKRKRGGVIALKTGNGKTLVTLILAHCLPSPRGRPSLVVVPDTLGSHWRTEATKHGMTDHVMVITNARQFKSQVLPVLARRKRRREDGLRPRKLVLIMTRNVVRCKAFKGARLRVSTLFVDEAHNLCPKSTTSEVLFGMSPQKITSHNWLSTPVTSTKCITADCVIPVTATPAARWDRLSHQMGMSTLAHVLKRNAYAQCKLISETVVCGTAFHVLEAAPSGRNGVAPMQTTEAKDAGESTGQSGSQTRLSVVKHEAKLAPNDFLVRLHTAASGLAWKDMSIDTTGARVQRMLEKATAGALIADEDVYVDIVLRLVASMRDRFTTSTRPSASNAPASGRAPVQLSPTPPTHVAYANSKDECCICLDAFDDPVQTHCHHVMCRTCLSSVVRMRARCPQCRSGFEAPCTVWTPRFADTDIVVAPAATPTATTTTTTTTTSTTSTATPGTRDIKRALQECKGEERSIEDLTAANVKYKQFKDDVARLKTKIDAGRLSRMVVFTSLAQSADILRRIVREAGLRIGLAGVNGVRRAQSIAAITATQCGQLDVLIASYRYSTGFDLATVDEMIMFNLPTTGVDMIQSMGRVTRLGQVNGRVDVKVYLYDGCYDSVLWRTLTSTAGKRKGRIGMTNEMAFAVEMGSACSSTPGTKGHAIRELTRRMADFERADLARIYAQPSLLRSMYPEGIDNIADVAASWTLGKHSITIKTGVHAYAKMEWTLPLRGHQEVMWSKSGNFWDLCRPAESWGAYAWRVNRADRVTAAEALAGSSFECFAHRIQ